MRKRTIVLTAIGLMTGAIFCGGAAVHAAADPAVMAVASDGVAGRTGPLRMLFSGQVGQLIKLKSDLHLTDDQRKQIQQIVASHRGDIAVALRPLVEKGRALRSAVIADSTDEQAIRSAAANVVGPLGDAAVVASKIHAEVAAVLTPDQKRTLAAYRAQRQSAVDRMIDSFAGRAA